MKPTLQLRLSQQLTLTPQLQQAIRMLQLSTVELAQEVEQALRENPLLERIDESLDSFGTGDFQGAAAFAGEQFQTDPGGTSAPESSSINGHASLSGRQEASSAQIASSAADASGYAWGAEDIGQALAGAQGAWDAGAAYAEGRDRHADGGAGHADRSAGYTDRSAGYTDGGAGYAEGGARYAEGGGAGAGERRAADGHDAYAGAEGTGDGQSHDRGRSDGGEIGELAWDAGGPDQAVWDTPRRHDGDDDAPIREWRGAEYRLSEHLQLQLMGCHVSERDKALVEWLIDALDENGLLREPLDTILAGLPAQAEVDPDELLTALKLLQSFDPPGVGARDAQECLGIQLQQREVSEASLLAQRIVRDHLASLAQRDFARLRRQLGCSEQILREAHAIILSLNPRPASGFQASEPMPYVVPDIVVKMAGRRFQAFPLRGGLPDIRLNERYVRLLKASRETRAEGAGLSEQIQSARWLVKNLRQRGETILRVARFIVAHQQRFFSEGAVAMLPLAMRTVADALGLHESTISRVTTQKFMLTPLGTFELKYFFTGQVGGDASTEAAHSSTAIRARVKQIIATESAERPMSDAHIAEILSAEGTQVARRTVAKYRESLRIPPTSQRRRQRF